MASEHDRSVPVEPLPPHPNLEMQQKRARNLLRAAKSGTVDALQRIRALHPRPPLPADLKLADAQLVVARGYGFESWAAMRRKIDSLTKSPIEQFHAALRAGDVDHVRELLNAHEEVRAAINQPTPHSFGSRPVSFARKNLALLDVLLEHGADMNLKSDWWAGPFGILEHDITPEEAAPLIQRGAIVDVFAAAHLGMSDRLRELVDADPSLIAARGGDGKTALHCARTVAIARDLIDRGADIDARDVDHESTPAQYLVREAPDVARLLLDRGAWFDVFIAVGLRNAALVERCLREDPDALDHRTGQGKYQTEHKGQPSARQIPDCRGDIYRWVFGHNVSVVDAARMLGYGDMLDILLRHASPVQRLLAACAAADRAAAEAVVAAQPDIVSTLTPDQMRLIADKAHANDTAAVSLMLDLGFDALTRGPDDFEAIRWAAFLGNPEMTRRLLGHAAPINVPDRHYGGTPLDQCVYGALHGWGCNTGDFAATARLLLEAGERVDPRDLPTGLDDLDAVLREYLDGARSGAGRSDIATGPV
jgi:hypothetical protein